MRFNRLYRLIMEELNAKQKALIDKYAKKRDPKLSFGPMFKEPRTYFDIDSSKLKVKQPPAKVKNLLDSLGYVCPDWRMNAVFKKEDVDRKRPIRFTKLLEQNVKDPTEATSLKKLFDNRLGTSRKAGLACKICITHDPYDIGGMSTGRNWTSCMNLDTGAYNDTPGKQVRFGGMVAYLIKADDLNIEDPIARVAIKRFVGQNDESCFKFEVEQSSYGDYDFAEDIGFIDAVEIILDKSNDLTEGDESIFERHDEDSWSDTFDTDEEMLSKKISLNKMSEDETIEYLKRHGELFSRKKFYETFRPTKKMLKLFSNKIKWNYLQHIDNIDIETLKEFGKNLDWMTIARTMDISREIFDTFKLDLPLIDLMYNKNINNDIDFIDYIVNRMLDVELKLGRSAINYSSSLFKLTFEAIYKIKPETFNKFLKSNGLMLYNSTNIPRIPDEVLANDETWQRYFDIVMMRIKTFKFDETSFAYLYKIPDDILTKNQQALDTIADISPIYEKTYIFGLAPYSILKLDNPENKTDMDRMRTFIEHFTKKINFNDESIYVSMTPEFAVIMKDKVNKDIIKKVFQKHGTVGRLIPIDDFMKALR